MNKDRKRELETNPDASLTKEELEEGWHFCWDWDFMLIHDSWKEAEACTCKKSKE